MYAVDEHDVVIPLADVPQSSVGAPLPVVLADETSTLVGYLVETIDPEWDGTTARAVGPESREPAAIVEFADPYALMFGPPNDEAFDGHPLAERGLEPYGAFEVIRSSWIRRLRRMNAVHPQNDALQWDEFRHFVLSFHDSTFECVARDLAVVRLEASSRADVLDEMGARLAR